MKEEMVFMAYFLIDGGDERKNMGDQDGFSKNRQEMGKKFGPKTKQKGCRKRKRNGFLKIRDDNVL